MKSFIFSLLLLFSLTAFSQHEKAYRILKERGEVVFSFQEENPEKIKELSNIISLDKKEGNQYTAYANLSEFNRFLEYGLSYQVLSQSKSLSTKALINMATTVDQMQSWDGYPTYPVYLQMMQKYANTYPDLCKIDTIGYSVQNRLILCARITNSSESPKPQFFYSSTMHGDELTGYVLMLRLIDYLLANPTQDPLVEELLNSVEIYINPLANPDGTYWASDMNVEGAKRYNLNDVDLNRNFPDPFNENPNLAVEKENQAMINYVSKHRFIMSANLHGGVEVFNYPWDSYTSRTKSHVDKNWWTLLGKNFIDTCRKTDAARFKDVTANGITNGGDWYIVYGGRQDYMNIVHKCREVTLEISTEKILPTNLLNHYWDTEYRALLNYIKEINYGFRGTVTDSVSGESIAATITLLNHDDAYSTVRSALPYGDYYRPVKAGNYSLVFSAGGYEPKTIENVSIQDLQAKELNVKLFYTGKFGIDNMPKALAISCYPNPVAETLHIAAAQPINNVSLFTTTGKQVYQKAMFSQTTFAIDIAHLCAGIYFVKMQDFNGNVHIEKVVKK